MDPWQLNKLLSQAVSSDDIEKIVRSHGATMNSVNCATALHRLARGGGASSSVEQSLCTITASTFEREAGGVTARSLTSVAWAVGKLRLSDKRLLAALTARAAAQLAADALDAFGIANIAWALATLHTAATNATTKTVGLDDECGDGVCDALAVAACARASDFKPQELTNLVWAFATLKWRHARLFEQLADVASARLAEFTPQGLSQTLWAYSKLGLTKHGLGLTKHELGLTRHGLFGAVASAALPRLASFDPQSIATLAWAFANLEIEHAPLAAAVCREARARADAFDSASCTQLLWALCRLRDGVEPLSVVALSRRLERVAAAGLAPQQLVYALGALAKLDSALRGVGGVGGVGGVAALSAHLGAAAAAAAPRLTANKLGIAAWALSRPWVVANRYERAWRMWSSISDGDPLDTSRWRSGRREPWRRHGTLAGTGRALWRAQAATRRAATRSRESRPSSNQIL